MNLHDIGKNIRGLLFRGNSGLAWGTIIRASQGKSHLYEFPVYNGWVATTVYANMYDNVEPIPACGKKVRAGVRPFQRMYAEKRWRDWCVDCDLIATTQGIPPRAHWFRAIRNETDLETFFENGDRYPR